MKRRSVLTALALVLIAVIAVFFVWFFHSSPHLDAHDISSIQQYRMPSPPEIITVRDEETIAQFADCYNAIDFTPIFTIRFPSGGWSARDVIELNNSSLTYNITFDKADGDQVLVKVNNRYFIISSSSYVTLLDILSNSPAAKAHDVTG